MLGCEGVKTRNWYAWNNKMPPRPDDFHVVGEVEVPNPGVDVELISHTPQGINPQIKLLDLVLTQRPGMWPQVLTWKQARYDEVLVNSNFTQADVLCGGSIIASMPVDTVV